MGPEGAVEIIFREEIEDPDKLAQRTQDYREKFANPLVASQLGFIDDIISPHSTRARLCRGLELLVNKKLENPSKKHDNIPL